MNIMHIRHHFTALIAGAMLAVLAFADEARPLRSRVCLNGQWDIAFSRKADGSDLSPWFAFRVPSAWGGMRHEAWDLPDEAGRALCGVYRLRLPVPEKWRGRKVRFFFERVDAAHAVTLNGRILHEQDHIGVCETVDATGTVRFGETNELLVATRGPSAYAGLCGDVFIEAVPETSFEHVLVDTSVKDMSIRVRARAAGRDGGSPAAGLSVRCVVLDGGKAVLSLPAKPLSATGDVETATRWENPILWGYGEYGRTHLYTLRAELRRGDELVDVRHERFGFREFGTSGDRFTLNGRPVFLKGDLYTKTRFHTEHPASIMAYFQRMRKIGLNFLRGHSRRMDNSVWAEVADETGFLFQPEMAQPFMRDGKKMPADSREIRAIWRNYILANYNHPSIISWCVDNESFSVGLATKANLAKLDVAKAAAYDALIAGIRALDPGRIVEINHNYCLWPLVKDGRFSRGSFSVFNIHPYGSIGKVMDGEMRATGFDGETPVLVGEVFCHDRAVDFAQKPREAFVEQSRVAKSYARQIAEAAATRHVAGIVLCGESGNGFIGYEGENALRLGPWDDYARIVEDGRQTGIRVFNVRPAWPSLSGRGVKVDRYPGWAYGGGNFGLGLNWFDPTAPMFRTSIIDRSIAESFAPLPGKVPPLAATRCPEVVATVRKGAGRLVFLASGRRPGEEEGVLADPSGTAWFRLQETGAHVLACGDARKEFRIDARPPLSDRPGFDHITWIDLGGGAADELRKPLRAQAAKETRNVLVKGEMLKNGSFDFIDHAGRPAYWYIGATNCTEAVPAGGRALRLAGGICATQQLRLEKGRTYRISGTVVKRKGRGRGAVFITSSNYRTIVRTEGSDETGKAERFSVTHLATGEEYYFYVDSRNMGRDSETLYDNLSVRLADDAAPQGDAAPAPRVISDEPGRDPAFAEGGNAVVYRVEGGKAHMRKIDLRTGKKADWSGTSPCAKGGAPLPPGAVAASPDGRHAAIQVRSGGTVNLRFVDARTMSTLFETKARSGAMHVNGCHSPAFSPDGRYAVYVSGGIQPQADLVLLDLETRTGRNLTVDHADNQSPSFSPDGRRVVFTSLVDGEHRVRMLELQR